MDYLGIKGEVYSLLRWCRLEYANVIHKGSSSTSNKFLIYRNSTAILKIFGKVASNPDSMLILEPQYRNVKEPLPLWVLYTIKSYHEVAGYVIVGEDYNEVVLSRAMKVIKKDLQKHNITMKAGIIIEKNDCDRVAMSSNNIRYYLGENQIFESAKIELAKYPFDTRKPIISLCKDIVNAPIDQLQNLMEEFKIYLEDINLHELWQYFKDNWFCKEWLKCWINVNRPGTKLLSESTFSCTSTFRKCIYETLPLSKNFSYNYAVNAIMAEFTFGAEHMIGIFERHDLNWFAPTEPQSNEDFISSVDDYSSFKFYFSGSEIKIW